MKSRMVLMSASRPSRAVNYCRLSIFVEWSKFGIYSRKMNPSDPTAYEYATLYHPANMIGTKQMPILSTLTFVFIGDPLVFGVRDELFDKSPAFMFDLSSDPRLAFLGITRQ
jgi:hypothetical protein